MRIGVYVGNYHPTSGGGYIFVQGVMDAFLGQAAQSDHEFVILCRPSYQRFLADYSLPDNVTIQTMPMTFKIDRVVAALKHASSLFAMLWPFKGLLDRLARKHQMHMIWFVGGANDTPATPFISTVWDLQHLTHPWFPELSTGYVWHYRQAFNAQHLRRAMRIITGTQHGKQEIQNFYGVPQDRIALLPHPTPTSEGLTSNAARPEGVPVDRPYLLYPAQFWAHKNHANLIRAMALIKKNMPDAPALCLVGSDKGNRAYIEQLIREHDLESDVYILGFVSNDTLDNLYQYALALVYPSFSGPENLPPLEAFVRGCPVLYADFPGAKEQLGDAALYFNPHDPQSIAGSITQLYSLDDKEVYIQKRKTRATEWTNAHYVSGVFELLDECATERTGWGA